jgi:MFS family permease
MASGRPADNVKTPPRPGSTNPFRHRAFVWLVSGRAVATAAISVAPIALAFAVLDLTGSVSDLGLVVGARSVMNLVLLPVSGMVADRLPRRPIMVLTMALAAVVQAAIASVVATGAAGIPLLVVLAAANGGLSSFSFPAGQALLPQTLPTDALQQGNALSRLTSQLSMIGSAAGGGLLVVVAGPAWTLAMTAGLFAAAAAGYGAVRVDGGVQATTPVRPSFLADLRDGWLEVARRGWLLATVVGFAFYNCAFLGVAQVLGPAMVDASFDRAAWGLALGCRTAGMVIGAIIAMRIRVRRFLFLGIGCMLAQVPFVLALTGGSLGLLLASAVLSGLAVEQFAVAWDTSLQQQIRADKLGRVYSYDAAVSYLAIPVGQVAAGPLAAAWGNTTTAAVAAGIATGSVLAVLAAPGVRRLKTIEPGTA